MTAYKIRTMVWQYATAQTVAEALDAVYRRHDVVVDYLHPYPTTDSDGILRYDLIITICEFMDRDRETGL